MQETMALLEILMLGQRDITERKFINSDEFFDQVYEEVM